MSTERELIKHVFATDQGRELLDLWGDVFLKPSHFMDQSSEHTAFLEGNRAFYTAIRMAFTEDTK